MLEKEREANSSIHAFRKRIRQLEAELDTEQDKARRAQNEADQTKHLMQRHLSSTSAGEVAHVQQEQVLRCS